MKRLTKLASACALVAGLLVAAAPGATAWGGDSGQGGQWPGHGHGGNTFQVVHAGQSIQAAIDAASPGGTVFVTDGTYAENLVITQTVKLIGHNATLVPPATPGSPSPCSAPDPNDDGICIAGQFTSDPDTGAVTVTSYVQNVTVTGFTISGFQGSGINQIGGQGSTFIGNTATGNSEYGIAAFDSSGTTEVFNRASGGGEAGFYIGDSHPANATLFGNVATNNGFGFFVRDAEGGKIVANSSSGNCVGILFLADAPGPDGAFTVFLNSIRNNSKACPATDEGPPVSGLGIAIAGAHDVKVVFNLIKGNTPGGDTPFNGGVVLLTFAGPTAPANNIVKHNIIVKNNPDIVSDGTGSGNVLQPNLCQTSSPDGLCQSFGN